MNETLFEITKLPGDEKLTFGGRTAYEAMEHLVYYLNLKGNHCDTNDIKLRNGGGYLSIECGDDIYYVCN